MNDDLEAAIDEAIQATGVERYRWLCSDENRLPSPNSRDDWRRFILERRWAGQASYPPLAQQAANLAGSLWTWAVSGFGLASDEEVARRLSICAACAEWSAADRRCKICGCFTDFKVRSKAEHCPLPEPRW